MSTGNLHDSPLAGTFCNCADHRRLRSLAGGAKGLRDSLITVTREGRNEGLLDAVAQALDAQNEQHSRLLARLRSERPEGRRSL